MIKQLSTLAVAVLIATASYATAPNNVVDKTDAVETSLYGHIQDGAIIDRVGQIELTLWGKENKAPLNVEVDRVYKVVEDDGETPTLRTKVDMIQWTYNGALTGGSIIERLNGLERGVFGRVSTKPIVDRVQELEKVVIGADKKIVLKPVTIPETTTFKIVFDKAVSTEKNVVGDTIPFTVAEDITDGNLLVVPEGTKGLATITELQKARSFGRGASLSMSFSGIMTAGGNTFDAEQGPEAMKRSKEEIQAAGASVAGIALLGPVGVVGGFFVKGKSISYPVGQGLYVQPTADVNTYGAGLEVLPVQGQTQTTAAPVTKGSTHEPEGNAEAAKTTEAKAESTTADTAKKGEHTVKAPDSPVVIIKKS